MLKDLTGQRFGKLAVLTRAENRGRHYWLCRCDCGNEKMIYGYDLVRGATQSCGCMQGGPTHGHTRGGVTRTYKCWQSMHQRCANPKHRNYRDYGGRDIKVCKRWLKFENFLADMGECPPGKSIDRYPNNDGNYEPGNTRWATDREQGGNMRSNNRITFNTRTRIIAEWARLYGVPHETIRSWIRRHGPDKALELAVLRAKPEKLV